MYIYIYVYIYLTHLWVKFSIQNAVLRLSSREKSKTLPCRVYFSSVFVPYFHKISPAPKHLWLRAWMSVFNTYLTSLFYSYFSTTANLSHTMLLLHLCIKYVCPTKPNIHIARHPLSLCTHFNKRVMSIKQ